MDARQLNEAHLNYELQNVELCPKLSQKNKHDQPSNIYFFLHNDKDSLASYAPVSTRAHFICFAPCPDQGPSRAPRAATEWLAAARALTGDARLEFLRNSGPAPEMKMERAGQ